NIMLQKDPKAGCRFEEKASRFEVLIGLGGNVGDVRATLDRAVATLCDRDIRLLAQSSDYLTPPWGGADQPAFVYPSSSVATTLPPRHLPERALAVERGFGRERAKEQRWGPRPIDIDLLDYENTTVDDPDLTLPHPRLLERAFVLVPLAEILPDRIVAGV